MISVVMATYNSHRFLYKQFDSILMQTNPIDEMIIVDDASSDNTVELINEYVGKHNLKNWKLFIHDKNQGFIKTFSEALSYAQGDIIILCDHDDIWFENKVEVIQKTFDSNPGIKALATSFCQIDENDNLIVTKKRIGCSNNNLIRRRVKSGQLNKMTIKDIGVYNISPGCTCAITKGLRDEYIKTDTNVLPHDWKLNLIAECYDGLYYLDVVTTKYRIYTGNTIGLGHQSNYKKRSNQSLVDFNEKKEMLLLAKNYAGIKSKEYLFFTKLVSVLKKRVEMYKSEKLISIGFPLFIQSFYFGKLYESIVMDIAVIIKNERG